MFFHEVLSKVLKLSHDTLKILLGINKPVKIVSCKTIPCSVFNEQQKLHFLWKAPRNSTCWLFLFALPGNWFYKTRISKSIYDVYPTSFFFLCHPHSIFLYLYSIHALYRYKYQSKMVIWCCALKACTPKPLPSWTTSRTFLSSPITILKVTTEPFPLQYHHLPCNILKKLLKHIVVTQCPI